MSDTSDSSTPQAKLRELYDMLGGLRLYNRDMFLSAQGQYQMLMGLKDWRDIKSIKYQNFKNKKISVDVQTDPESGQRSNIYQEAKTKRHNVEIEVDSYQRFMDEHRSDLKIDQKFYEVRREKGCPVYLDPQPTMDKVEYSTFEDNYIEEILESFYVDRKHELTKISEVLKDVARITRIVCLGLGSMEDPSRKQLQIAQNHKIAFMLEELLRSKFGAKKGYIEMFFEDQTYSRIDNSAEKNYWRSLGEHEHHVQFLEFPKGLLKVDKHTLVLTHGDNRVPYRQLVADLTEDKGGPAGIYCRTVHPVDPNTWDVAREIQDYTLYEGDPCNRYVAHMVKDYIKVDLDFTDKVPAAGRMSELDGVAEIDKYDDIDEGSVDNKGGLVEIDSRTLYMKKVASKNGKD